MIKKDYQNVLKEPTCEIYRFPSFEVFQSYDENRICVYSLKNRNQDIQKKLKNKIYDISTYEVITGLDIAEKSNFEFLEEHSFALFTNATGLNRNLKSTLDILIENGYFPKLLIEPEHGIYSAEDQKFSSIIRIEKTYSIPILSLYSEIKKPPLALLKDIDTILIDLKNLPVRCYTYVSTLTYLLEVADQLHKEVIILDRPHPYGIWKPMGGFLQEEYRSFVGEAPVPFLYNLTPAEYSIFLTKYKLKNLKLKIIKMEYFDPKDTQWVLGNIWINPSPNIPDLETALIYPGLVFFEGTPLSVGRGTTKPFIYSGAPWLNHKEVIQELQKLSLKGIKVGLVEFRPTYSVYKGELCKGIQIHPISKELNPLEIGYEYMRIIRKLHPDKFYFKQSQEQFFIDKLWGSDLYRKSIEHDLNYKEFENLWKSESLVFEDLIKDILIYR
ncbi:MAG: DUF1343 domain-containing protein [Leptospiraceae bacterium]|nr:DUF1343 domain-containing protein [Leptospiraceae bacterium]MDW7976921.1 DUF1343 domain-containing protein [Leptospiraceae bacterium]